MTSSFETLNKDIVALILHEIVYSKGSFDAESLFPVSLVSKSFRRQALPLVFSQVRWFPHFPGERTQGDLPPQHLLRYIKTLKVITNEDFRPVFQPEPTLIAFSQLSSATKLIVRGAWGTLYGLITLYAVMPALQEMEVYDARLLHNRSPLNLYRITGLHRLLYWTASSCGVRGRAQYLRSSIQETTYLTDLILASRSSLQYLDMPGESLNIDRLSKHAFSNLKTLILRGLVSFSGNVVLFELIAQMPNLSVLEVRLIDRKSRAVIEMLPPTPSLDIFPSFRHHLLFPSLRSLTLFNPTRTDEVFMCLPPGLQFLALSDHEAPHHTANPEEALLYNPFETFNMLQKAHISALRELQLYVMTDIDGEWIRALGRILPNLEILELHRNKCLTTPAPFPSFSSFQTLKVLRLALLGAKFRWRYADSQIHELSTRVIVEHGPASLQRVGFLAEPPADDAWRTFPVHYWGMYDITRHGSNYTLKCRLTYTMAS